MQTSIHSTAELAVRLGLSRWTVSRALNRHPEVNAETAERVLKEAERLGFSPSILGRGLRRGRTDLVGVVAPDLEAFYLTRKMSVLRERIEKAGMHGVFQFTDSTAAGERAALERFSAIRCAGVVNVASQLAADDQALERLVAADVPVVQIDPMTNHGRLVISTDRAAALRKSVKHLAELGHRKIAFFAINPSTFYGGQRLEGIASAGRELKWKAEKAFQFYQCGDLPDSFEAGAEMAGQFAKQGTGRPTAIIAMNDQIALGALGRLRQEGWSVPKEVSLMGYDDADFSSHMTPPLTTFNPQAESLMHKAMDALLAESSASVRVSVRPRIVLRRSTAQPSGSR